MWVNWLSLSLLLGSANRRCVDRRQPTGVKAEEDIGLADMLDDHGVPDPADLVVPEPELKAVRLLTAASGGGGGVDTAVLDLGVLGRLGAEVLKTGAAGLDVTTLQTGTPGKQNVN